MRRDDYPTPPWAVLEIKPEIDLIMSSRPNEVILEPSCGTGSIISTLSMYQFDAVELANTYDALSRFPNIRHVYYNHDYLKWSPPQHYRCCVMNPPYSHALKFIEKATQESDHVFAFLKLSFLESKERHTFLKRRMPSNIWVFPQRVPSTQDGGSDNAVRAWFHWRPESESIDTRLHLLDLRTNDVRKQVWI